MTRRRPGMAPVLASVAVHLLILVPLMAFTRIPEPIEFETIRVNLVMAPEPAPAPQVVEQPRPQPVETRPEPRPREEPRPEPPPQPPPEQRTERRPDPEPERPRPAREPEPDDAGGAPVTVETAGRDFPYPEYLNNVIIQIHRYFRWTEQSQPRGLIYFEIREDGSVRNIRMVRSSGNLRFDFALQGAVETAGNRGAFGPLPDGFAAPMLPIQLEVEPPR